MSFIELKNLGKSYDKQRSKAVSDVNLTIDKGDFVVLVGPCLLYTSPSPRDS